MGQAVGVVVGGGKPPECVSFLSRPLPTLLVIRLDAQESWSCFQVVHRKMYFNRSGWWQSLSLTCGHEHEVTLPLALTSPMQLQFPMHLSAAMVQHD